MPTKTNVEKEEVTLKDIAEAVGKSVAAVSRALNDHDDISSETRSHIKEVANQMGYTPNLLAQRLQKQATDTLGLILPIISPRSADPFFSELLVGVATAATEQGYDLLVSTCAPGEQEEQLYERLVSSRRVDGIIIAQPRWQDPRLELLQQKKFPFVVVGSNSVANKFLSVYEDAVLAANLVVQHVVEKGYTKIALVNTPKNYIFASDFRTGFQGAMLKVGLAVNEEWLQSCDIVQKEGYRAGQILLSKTEAPTAVIATDDVIALGVLAAAQDQGLEVGHDLAVAGYGNILLAEHSQPPLTTVQRHSYTLGQRACRLLVAQLQGKAATEIEKLAETEATLKPSLVIRQSTDLALWL